MMKSSAWKKGKEMLTATEWTTGATAIVKPIAIRRPNGAYDMLLIADANTGNGIWFTNDGEWHIDLQTENEYPLHDAEVVAGVYGDDEKEWEERANELLAAYGLKLGRFDENARDRWELIEL